MLFTSQVPFKRDILLTTNPLRQFLKEELTAGHFPGWYPYEMLGVPFAGSVVASPFHPQTLLLAFLSPAVSTKWSILLAYLLGLVGAYRLARRFRVSRVAAVAAAYAFGFSGCLSSLYSNVPFLVPLATAPWMLATTHRLAERGRLRDVATTGVWWALVFLGGDAQLAMECGILGAGLVLLVDRSWRKLALFGGAAVLAGALSGAELLPALAWAGESNRSQYKANTALAQSWALHPLRLLELFVPQLIPAGWRVSIGPALEVRANFFIYTWFAGGSALLLACCARTRVALAAALAALVSVWLALGEHGGLLRIAWKTAPFLTQFRYPEKYAAIASLMLIILVALGVDAVIRAPQRMVAPALIAGAVLLVLAAFVARSDVSLSVLALAGVPTDLAGDFAAAMRGHWAGALVQTGFVALLLGALAASLQKTPRLALLIPALVAGELWLGNHGMPELASRDAVEAFASFSQAIASHTPPGEPAGRVLALEQQTFPPNIDVNEFVRRWHQQLSTDDGGRQRITPLDVNSSAEPWRVVRTLWGRSRAFQADWFPRVNTCYRVEPKSPQLAFGEVVIAMDQEAGLQLVQGRCLGRAYFARTKSVPDAKAAHDVMNEGMPDDAAVWEGGPELTDVPVGSVRWIEYLPDSLKLEAEVSSAAALVISDAFASGWQATVDGWPAPIYATNVFERGLALTPGKHLVQMSYHAPGFTAGCVLSLLGVCAAVLLLLSRRPASEK